MDCAEVKGEGPVEQQLEPLLILEEGDEPDEFANNTARGKGILRVKKAEDEDVEEDGGITESIVGYTGVIAQVEEGENTDINLNEEKVEVEKVEAVEGQQEEAAPRNEDREPEQVTGTEESSSHETQESSEVKLSQTEAGSVIVEKAVGEAEGPLQKMDKVATEKLLLPTDGQSPAKLRPRNLLRPEDAQQKIHRLSTDFPDTLYELLCTLQEGRRLNDQRCSFRLEGRRRCYSEPSTPRHSQKVLFSSMTSLQKEEFFDLLATSQGRRLDDQRADFQSLSPAPSSPEPAHLPAPPAAAPTTAPSEASQAKAKLRKGSWKTPEASRTVPRPAPKEELYNMILNSQAQGRLEEQRSTAPGPMDDEDFFSLLLKVQGGRMDEQRTELPVTLKY